MFIVYKYLMYYRWTTRKISYIIYNLDPKIYFFLSFLFFLLKFASVAIRHNFFNIYRYLYKVILVYTLNKSVLIRKLTILRLLIRSVLKVSEMRLGTLDSSLSFSNIQHSVRLCFTVNEVPQQIHTGSSLFFIRCW